MSMTLIYRIEKKRLVNILLKTVGLLLNIIERVGGKKLSVMETL